jgi:archaellum component FlaC
MSELTKKRVHWKEYNGEELIHDEDVDILTSADAVTFDDGETMQYKYSQGQFVSPSDMGDKSNLSTTNKSTLVDAINEVKTAATSNESSIDSLTNRVTTSESDIDSLETRMSTAENDVDNLETRMTTAESDIDNVESRMNTAESDIDNVEFRMNTAENDIDSLETRVTPISLGGTGATTESEALANLGGASTETYTATIGTEWSENAPYMQTVTITGITGTDTPIVDVILSTTTSTALNQLEAWGCVSKIETETDSITVTCLEDKPTTAIPIQLKVVR